MSVRRIDGAGTFTRGGVRPAVVFATVIAVVVALVAPLGGVPAAHAGPGSRVSGVVWSDANRDGVRQTTEAVKSGVTVQLLSSPDGAVVATTTTAANGTYSFADAADGDFVVRVDAPGTGRFPDAAAGDNSFIRAGDPNPGDPERGVTTPFTITGAAQVVRNAGFQPIADLKVTKMEWSDACEGFARTGLPPFDADDEPGHDSGTANCRVRPQDSVYQNYSVALTGLPTGASVPNVVAEFTISSPDNAKLRLRGPAAGGMPDGCLYAANGAVPTSSSRTNADGSITVICNLGTMSSNVAAIQLVYDFASDTPIPSHAEISMRAYAAGGDAGNSNTVNGPLVEVTGIAKWELRKSVRGFATSPAPSNPRYVVRNGQPGYQMRYMFEMQDMLQGKGAELQWPLTFHDQMPEFPNAVVASCSAYGFYDGGPYPNGESWTMPNCPVGQTQGPDGWTLRIQKGNPATLGHTLLDVWIPAGDMYRQVDPSWQPGQPAPTGTYTFDNLAKDTDTWAINGGQLNYGDGREPGYDGTGDNLATFSGEAKPSQWDLQKFADGGPVFTSTTVNGTPMEGYTQRYRLRVRDLTPTPNLAPFLDDPLTFKDKFFVSGEFAPDAVLTRCYAAGFTVLRSNNSYSADTGTPTCTTGTQPGTATDMDTGWELTFHPNQWAHDLHYADMFVDIFVPMAEFEVDPCTDLTTEVRFRNIAVQSDGWTALGLPMNGSGFEPGWDGTEATGNNVVDHRLNFSGQCGTLTGSKSYVNWADGQRGDATWAGRIIGSSVNSVADNARVKVTNFQQCDVFDVSVFQLGAPRGGFPRFVTVNTPVQNLDTTDYVMEYAVGPNQVDTQAGPQGANGLYPIDASSNDAAARDCRGFAGPWLTDPAQFGEGWQDRVNMVRVRPLDPTTVATGPFNAFLQFDLQSRLTYNGGPNAGEMIPAGVLTHNVGGWPSGNAGGNWGSGWSIGARDLVTVGPGLQVEKNVTPNTYLPGDTVTWNLNARAVFAYNGQTIYNVRLVDTIPQGLEFNLACTRNLLPAGVTVAYDAVARQVTFAAGDVLLERVGGTGAQWMFHQSDASAARGALKICTDVSELAQPGTNYINRVQLSADNSSDRPSAQATILVVGTGKLGIEKHVDKPYVASGDRYDWSLEWGNTSQMIPFQAPDVIDVLPWNGDFAVGSLSKRDQYATDFQGSARLIGELAPPVFLAGATGEVAGTWYYSTANPATINHDSRVAANASPQTPGGLWLVAGEVSDFSQVTAIRFVSSEDLPVRSRVRADIPARSTSTALDNVYVNRASIVSPSFPDDLLFSNEPYVLMPGFTLGDLVWADRNGNGKFDIGEQGIAGVTVQVRDADGEVVATRVTDANGRWSADALPAGDYTAHIPAAMFRAGGPLADFVVRTVGSGDADGVNEGVDNNNTAAPDPRSTGLTSTAVTLAYEYAGDRLVGGDGPTGDDVARLAGPLIPDEFTTFTVDLALLPGPAIDIEKSTNLQDADTPTGPYVPVGGAVVWTYVVTNTGDVDLTDIEVTDDLVDPEDIDCAGTGSNFVPGPLAPAASVTCVATGTATAGQYANTGTVTGLDPTAVEVTDEDPSHYFGSVPAIDIEKATNGEDADEPTGPLVPVDGAVEWTYVVTNTGNVPLTDVTVTDDQVAAAEIDCAGTGSNVVPGPLAPEASVTCVASGIAVAGQYANLGTVTGTAPATTDAQGVVTPGVQVDDEDPSHYFGVASAVDIEKATNGQDADEPTGPLVAVGEDVRWTYVVTNTGNVPLTNVTVTDDQVGAADIDCAETGSNVVPGPLAPEASFTCVATGTAVAGQYANLGTVTGIDPLEAEVTDVDASHYFGANPAVDIEKATNTIDADEPTGPYVPVDGSVEWTYEVTNTGNVPLTDVTVTDDQVGAGDIDCAGTGSNVVPGPLAPQATVTCVATGTAIVGQYANLGTVTGVGPETTDVEGLPVPGVVVSDDDPSHYFGAAPAIDIEKAVNGQDADRAPGVAVTTGAVVEWTYVVTNTGNSPLVDVTVTDDKVAAFEIWCNGTQSNVVPGPLAPGASFTCNALGVAIQGAYVNTGTATGRVPGTEVTVTDTDPAHYLGTMPPKPASAAAAALPATGGALPVIAISVGVLAALLGALLLITGRRRRA
ncbi:SdrD B-like domain-containing protein [Microbacterium sp. M3]|uniref:SdrD B-like domain-containing protein n=1 Tax=Microbacterium arthrosphaerae TaxID=792652 RepID=A0ABU4GY48_9MICO|nr:MULTISPECIES: SdrD B-like domain-containing protein [Microbacterium]MDW4571996.1 SdrD B-like domain-containing protein [Microbacterium arthrosphaerae]MDW7605851.1 SdrD B-like domain-containing protein [Microbacterium sp. M3]